MNEQDDDKTRLSLLEQGRCYLEAHYQELEARVSTLEKAAQDLLLEVRVLKLQVSWFAGLGAVVGGAFVSVIELGLLRALGIK